MYNVPKLKSYSAAVLDKAGEKLLAALKQEATAVKNEADWKAFRDRWMARKNGVLTEINELWLKAAPKDAKREVGQRVNSLKSKVEWQVDNTHQEITQLDTLDRLVGPDEATFRKDVEQARRKRQSEAPLDVTLPGTRRHLGSEHPVIKTMNEIVTVFRNLGYSVQEGRGIETDYYNFE